MVYRACFDWMWQHKAWTVFGAGTVLVLGSEVVWWLWKKIRYLLTPKPPLYDVIFFNELGEECSVVHYHLIRLKVPKEKRDCGNPHCSERNVQKLVDQIDTALYSVDAAIFSFSSVVMTDAFERALSRNVRIRILTDRQSAGNLVFQKLRRLGVIVHAPKHVGARNALMHHKFFVVDTKSRVLDIQKSRGLRYHRPILSRFAAGSINWTMQGFGGNWENCVISHEASLTEVLQEEFNRLWEISTDTAPVKRKVEEYEELW